MNFPIFISLKDKPCLVVGGGAVAKRKCETLLEYGASVTVVAKALRADFSDLMRQSCPQGEAAGTSRGTKNAAQWQYASVQLYVRPFEAADLNDRVLVFVATEDAALNREIVSLCHERHILVNVADIPELCDFYFPALVRRGDVVVGVSTGGGSPALAGRLRGALDEVLPQELGIRAEELAALRRELLAKGKHPAQDAQYQEMIDSVKLR